MAEQADQADVLDGVASACPKKSSSGEKNIHACEAAGIDPVISVACDENPPAWREWHREPAECDNPADPIASLENPSGTSALRLLRKQTVEPVFGTIESVMGYCPFSLRGLKQVTDEWTLVCLEWNLKRMAKLCLQ
ncbi:MAG: hypothetical protein AW06_000709 [Candidatus Accumulibacter cognatus]|uniref:Transposase DDE domain-containing protein n=1 Tax=Candidatus Accumulibacter cognatus TaxID=2954383 RepID=A0A080M9D1_9PROT|nr:MAG: hypothetical protein AW06_000709 [Candidatus Accumulibacter cognatus]